MVMSGLSTPGLPGASLFVHLAADGKTVVANIPGLILLVSVLAGLGAALIVGLVNGFCIAALGLSPFVTTLGMLSIVRGLGYVISNGRGASPGGRPWAISIWHPAPIAMRAAASLVTMPPEL